MQEEVDQLVPYDEPEDPVGKELRSGGRNAFDNRRFFALKDTLPFFLRNSLKRIYAAERMEMTSNKPKVLKMDVQLSGWEPKRS